MLLHLSEIVPIFVDNQWIPVFGVAVFPRDLSNHRRFRRDLSNNCIVKCNC